MRKRDVEVLVFDGCPNVELALERARAAVAGANVPAEVRLVLVDDDEDAKRLRFPGSPTVRVDGIDIDPAAADREQFGLQCRLYSVGGRLDGAPPIDWIASALRGEAMSGAVSHVPAAGCACGKGEPR